VLVVTPCSLCAITDHEQRNHRVALRSKVVLLIDESAPRSVASLKTPFGNNILRKKAGPMVSANHHTHNRLPDPTLIWLERSREYS